MKADQNEVAELRRAASALGKLRMAGLGDEGRKELSRLAHSARWSRPTKQDKRITDSVKASFANAIYAAVDHLFDGFANGGAARMLVVHQGEARVMDPATKDCRIQQKRFPDSIIGTYDRRATREQVIDDIAESCHRWHP